MLFYEVFVTCAPLRTVVISRQDRLIYYTVSVLRVNVGPLYCYDCVTALRRFVGGMKGIESVEVEDGMVEVRYSAAEISEREVLKIISDTVQKLGYSIIESSDKLR